MKKIIPNGDMISKDWFNRGFANYLIHMRGHLSLDITADFIMENGFRLGEWVSEVRDYWQEEKLTQKQQYLLEMIGLSKDEQSQGWETMYCYVKNYRYKYGTLPDNISFSSEDGIMIGAWIDRQKRFSHMLSDEQIDKLKQIGVYV